MWATAIQRPGSAGHFRRCLHPQRTDLHGWRDGFRRHVGRAFTSYHRRSYVCKSGVGDVLIGAAATVAEYNGVESASHIRDKLVEMTHLNETIYATGIASSYQSMLPSPARTSATICWQMFANTMSPKSPMKWDAWRKTWLVVWWSHYPPKRIIATRNSVHCWKSISRGATMCRPSTVSASCA